MSGIVAVVQARNSSNRLPGKVMMPILGTPMLEHLMNGLQHCVVLDQIVIATSTDASDDIVEDFCEVKKWQCFRGSLNHVAERLCMAAQSVRAHALVRVSADSPLLDPAIVDLAVGIFSQNDADVVTNVRPRSFPKGQSIEIISLLALENSLETMNEFEREHVLPFFYEREDQFRILGFSASHPRPEVQLSVDTLDDFNRCEEIIRNLSKPHWEAGWQECVKIYDQLVKRTAKSWRK